MTNFTDPVNRFTGNFAFDTSNTRRKTFPILGELIRMSCIDPLDELRQARAANRTCGAQKIYVRGSARFRLTRPRRCGA